MSRLLETPSPPNGTERLMTALLLKSTADNQRMHHCSKWILSRPGPISVYSVQDDDGKTRVRAWCQETDEASGPVRTSIRLGLAGSPEAIGLTELVSMHNNCKHGQMKRGRLVRELFDQREMVWKELKFIASHLGWNFHGTRFARARNPARLKNRSGTGQ